MAGEKINDGGPAFPAAKEIRVQSGYDYEMKRPAYETQVQISTGMSLRDWYAGMALQGILAASKSYALDPSNRGSMDSPSFGKLFSQHAYIYADAMLKARGQ